VTVVRDSPGSRCKEKREPCMAQVGSISGGVSVFKTIYRATGTLLIRDRLLKSEN
jgi:hypothetical protein